jgi:glycosyltransferase involved in cell wall biosynthesis
VTEPPSVVFGLPVYNGEQHLQEALDSLLWQTRRDLAVVVVDNCSTDGTAEITRRCAEGDPRVVGERNERTLGLVHNWRRAFDLAGRLFPGAPYFAWASDHDVWEPGWLESLVPELDVHPEAVLAYPLCVRIDEHGEPFRSGDHVFDTVGLGSAVERLRRSIAEMPAGDLIYGLIRRDALERCGPFPLVLLPDRLQLARLALEGQFRQVQLPLWRRRYREGVEFAVGRQRRAFFVDGVPATAYLPWWATHTALFARAAGRRLAAVYLRESLRQERRRRGERGARRRGWRRKRRRRFLRRVSGGIRRRLGLPAR